MAPKKKTTTEIIAPTVTKSHTSKILLIVYITFSLLFIAYSFFNYLRSSVYNAWAQVWYTEAYRQISERASECKVFNVNYWNQKYDLINVSCLQAPNSNENTQVSPASTPSSN
jgi:hypothetical protein